MIDAAIAELTPLLGSKRAACAATGRPQANHYRRHRQSPKPVRPATERKPQPRALSAAERDTVRSLLNSPDFVDKAPATVYHELLDEGVYVASVSSMYRILRAHGEVRERRRQAIADLKASALAHLPSGSFQANNAWLTLAAIAHNLTRAAGCAASALHAKAETATIRDQLIAVPARVARSARRLILHLPEAWPWEHAWQRLFTAAHAPPAAAA